MITWKPIAQVFFILIILFEIVLCGSKWYSANNGKRFLIDFSKMYNWHEAMHKCSIKNLHLIEIDSAEKNQIVTELLDSIPKVMGFFWLGGTNTPVNQPKKSHTFHWTTSGAEFTYTNWAHYNDEISIENESCVYTTTSFTSYKWHVTHCNSSMFDLICEEYEEENLKHKDQIDKFINQKLSLKTNVNSSTLRVDFSWKIIFTTILWLIIANVIVKKIFFKNLN